MATKPTHSRTQVYKIPAVSYYKADGSRNGTSGTSTYSTFESKYSDGNPVPSNGHWVGDIGSPFFHKKQTVSSGATAVNVVVPSGSSKGQRVNGVYHIYNGAGIQSKLAGVSLIEPLKATLDAQGTTAIARCNPDNPAFSFAQFLGELHEGVPKIIGSGLIKERTRHFKQLGGEYLNVQFGWLPFVSDIQSAANAVVNSHKIINDYRRQSGKLIRRKYAFPSDVSTSTNSQTGIRPNGPTTISSQFAGPGTGTLVTEHSVTVRNWFSGAFTVHMNPGTTQMGKLEQHYQQAQHLLGVGLTPDVVWELTPWSWLADWFTNIGDIMSNVRAFAFDGMVMPYGYVMRETRTVDTYSLSYGNAFADGQGYSGSLIIESVIQNRVPANPFGFGVTIGALSARQVAILAALGITQVA